MKILSRVVARAIAVISLALGFGFFAYVMNAYTRNHRSIANTIQQETLMPTHATGTFEVKLNPQDDKSDDQTLGRMTIEKHWHGDLEGTSKGQMLTAGTSIKSSAGYVAIEKVSGTLKSRKGTFVLQHTGTMTRGEGQLTITVVPDSGTDQLEGLSGKMKIKIENGKHFYEFEYALGKKP